MREADKLATFMCRMSWKCGSLSLLEPSGPHRPVTGLLYLYLLLTELIFTFCLILRRIKNYLLHDINWLVLKTRMSVFTVRCSWMFKYNWGYHCYLEGSTNTTASSSACMSGSFSQGSLHMLLLLYRHYNIYIYIYIYGAWGSTVVKVLCY